MVLTLFKSTLFCEVAHLRHHCFLLPYFVTWYLERLSEVTQVFGVYAGNSWDQAGSHLLIRQTKIKVFRARQWLGS